MLSFDKKNWINNTRSYLLESGLKVVLYKDVSKPKVLVQLAYDVGSSIEKSDEKGLAHLVEHMIFKGTTKLKEGDVDAVARKFGAQFNASTSHDVTTYYFESNKNNWEVFLDLLSDCMYNAKFDDQHLCSELKAVVQELNQFVDCHEVQVVERSMASLFASNHPYHFPIIGFKEVLTNLTAQKLKDFYKENYRAEKAVLFLAGDIDFDDSMKKIETYFGPVKLANVETFEVNLPTNFPVATNYLESVRIVKKEDINVEKIIFCYKIEGLETIDTAMHDCFLDLFGSTQSSELQRFLIDEKQIAQEVLVQPDLMHREGVLIILILPKPGHTEECIRLFDEKIQQLASKGFSEQMLARSKLGLALSFLRKTESMQSLVSDWINEVILSGCPAKIFDYLDGLKSVSIEQINQFLIKYVATSGRVETILRPFESENDHEKWSYNLAINKQSESELLARHTRSTPLDVPEYVDTVFPDKKLAINFPLPTLNLTLKNGLDFICYVKNGVPISYFKLQFKTNNVDNKSLEGLKIDLVMQMLIEQSISRTKQENIDALDDLGAHYSFEADGFSLTTLQDYFLPALKIMLEIFLEPKFDASILERQKDLLIADLSERSEDPQKLAIKKFYSQVFPQTFFDWDYAAGIKYVQKLSLQEVVDIHRQLINPKNSLVACGGVVTAQDVVELLESKVPSSNFSSRHAVEPAADLLAYKKSPVKIKLRRDQVFVMLARPSGITVKDELYLYLAIANIIIFYGLGSRVYKIREQWGFFYSMLGGYSMDAGAFSSMDYMSTMLNASDIEPFKRELFKEFHSIFEHGFTSAELDDAKQLYLESLINIASDTSAALTAMLSLKLFGLDFDFYKNVLSRLEQMTVEDLNAKIQQFNLQDNFIEILVGKI